MTDASAMDMDPDMDPKANATAAGSGKEWSHFVDLPPLPEAVLEYLPSSQQEQLKAHHTTVLRQKTTLHKLLEKQVELTGLHPLLDEKEPIAVIAEPKKEADQVTEAIAAPSPVEVAPAPVPASLPGSTETSPVGKVSRLTQEAEQVLLTFFSVQDTLTREASLHLAQEAGCSDAQVREYFGRLRSSVRSFIQRFQRKTLGIAVGSHAAPAAPGIPAGTPTSIATGTAAEASSAAADPEEDSPGISEALKAEMERTDALRNEGLEKLQGFLDESGGIARLSYAEAMAGLMRAARSWSVKEACLQAVQHTRSSAVLEALAKHGNLLDMLATWASDAERDDQISVLSTLLSALRHLPLTPQDLRYSPLPKALLKLQAHRLAEVVELARAVLQQWRLLDGAPVSPSAPSPANTALDPSKLAVPLRKPGLPARRSGGGSSAPRSREQSHGADDFSRSKSAAQKGLKPSALRTPAKVARLDASSLGNIKGPARHGHLSAYCGSQTGRVLSPGEQIQHATARYQESAARLQAAQEHQRQEEAARTAEAARRVSQADFAAKAPPIFPPLDMHIAPAADVRPVGQGEESYELQSQTVRIQSEAEATYVMPELIPNSPAEPWDQSHNSHGGVLVVPFTPTDTTEAMEQATLMRSSGVLLGHLLNTSQPVQLPAGTHLPHGQPAVPGVFYASQGFQAGQQQRRR